MPYHLATPQCLAREKRKKGLGFSPNPFDLGWVMGLEPTTLGTTIRCSNQLSYTHHINSCWTFKRNGTPEGTRTPGLLLRRQLLYPTELLAHMERVTRIELASPAWKAGALAIVLYPHVPSDLNRQPCYHSMHFWICQGVWKKSVKFPA